MLFSFAYVTHRLYNVGVSFRSVVGALTSVLAPAPCRLCERPLLNASRIPICPECLASFVPVREPYCKWCGRPFPVVAGVPVPSPDALCRLCRDETFWFDRARSFGVYDHALHNAILLLKYEQITRLGNWFAKQLAELVAREPEEFQADVVVPVPLHPARERERGYNQAELIARPLARMLGLKQGSYLLMRTKPRPARLVLSRKEHWESVRGAYATRKGLRVDKLRVLLVDDVMTTGATLDACSRALKSAGATSVMGLTVARVVMGLGPSDSPAALGAAGATGGAHGNLQSRN
jgi:competence protein ComFC